MPGAAILNAHEVLTLGLQCTVGLSPGALMKSAPSAKENQRNTLCKFCSFMEEQNAKSHVYLFFKKLFSVSVMSCNESSPGVRNTGTVRTVIQLVHFSVFVTHLYKKNLCIVWNLVIADFSRSQPPYTSIGNQQITTCDPLYQYNLICFFSVLVLFLIYPTFCLF